MDFADLARAVFALAVTLGLVGLAAVGARRFGPDWLVRLQTGKKTRRLAVIETLVLDPQRRLVLVRCDDTERLIMLGEGLLLSGPAANPKETSA